MSSGGSRSVTGVYTGTGAALNIDKVGFEPKYIEIFTVAGAALAKATFVSGMADASALLEDVNGSKTLVTVQGITPRAAGFGLGTNASLNTLNATYRYFVSD